MKQTLTCTSVKRQSRLQGSALYVCALSTITDYGDQGSSMELMATVTTEDPLLVDREYTLELVRQPRNAAK